MHKKRGFIFLSLFFILVLIGSSHAFNTNGTFVTRNDPPFLYPIGNLSIAGTLVTVEIKMIAASKIFEVLKIFAISVTCKNVKNAVHLRRGNYIQ